VIEFRPGGDVNDIPQIRQRRVAPCVYLDHWAFAKFSRDQQLGGELVAAVHEREGTLAFGILNLVEFSGVTDATQARAAEQLVEALLPRIYFMRFAFHEVFERENALWRGESAQGPSGDEELLGQFCLPAVTGRSALHARGLFAQVVAQRALVQAHRDRVAQALLKDLTEFRTQTTDAGFRAQIRAGMDEGAQRPRATLALARALVLEIKSDRNAPLTDHDAIDLLHTVVPVAWCELVLLDGRWCDLVERARQRLLTVGVTRLARVFSDRGDGVAKFLSALRTHPKDSRPPSHLM
jgi:hypothetical protein